MQISGFPGSSVVGNPLANTRDMGSIPGRGRSHMLQSDWAHTPQLLSLCSRAWELRLLKPECPRACALNKRSHCSEKPMHHNYRVAPGLRNYREALTSSEDPAWPKINKFFLKESANLTSETGFHELNESDMRAWFQSHTEPLISELLRGSLVIQAPPSSCYSLQTYEQVTKPLHASFLIKHTKYILPHRIM